MKAEELVLRCMAEREGDQWVAQCLDLCLAAQGDSYDDARSKLEAMMYDYVKDALIGEDRMYADQLMTRKAPFSQWVKYYKYKVVNACCDFRNNAHRLFSEVLPLVPGNHKHA